MSFRERMWRIAIAKEGHVDAVQGYVYRSVDEEDHRNERVCRIIRRAEVSDADVRENGPAFTVVFGDGEVTTAYSDELHPWYPFE